MKNSKNLGLIGLVGSAFVGGAIMPTLIRTGVSTLHPFIFNWLRALIGLLIALVIFRGKYKSDQLFKKDNRQLLITIGIGLGLNITLYSLGVSHTTLVASQLIYTLVPVIATLLAFFINQEKINTHKILGMILALSGILTLIFFSAQGHQNSSVGTLYGNLLIFIAMFGYSSYLTFSKKYNSHKNVFEMTILSNLGLTLFLFPMAAYQMIRGPGLGGVTSISLAATLGIVIAALAFTSLSQLALKYLSTSTSALGSILNSQFAALVGIIFYSEKISLALIASC